MFIVFLSNLGCVYIQEGYSEFLTLSLRNFIQYMSQEVKNYVETKF